jgi:hypothetical protein
MNIHQPGHQDNNTCQERKKVIMNKHVEIFQQKGYVLVKNFIPKETANYLFEYIRFTSHAMVLSGKQTANGDEQVPGSFGVRHGDMAFDSLMRMMKPKMEECTGLELYPTYTYARLYRPGNELKKHTDRPSCEVSITLKLSDTGQYNWPIWMVDAPYELEDGDGVIYRGCDLEHWRDICGGPPEYRLGQVFMHYVDKNGPYPEYRYDKRYALSKLFESDL